jgi:hypothetical protein
MSAPAAGRLLISHITLRGPELRQVYDLVAERGPLAYGDLIAALAPPGGSVAPELADAPLLEALGFLVVAGLLEARGPSRRRAAYRATPLLPDAPFPLLLLRHIRAHPEERQRALSLVYDELVAADAVGTTAAALRDQMERGPHRALFAWTGEKIGLWVHLADHLGLVRRLERSAEVLVVPQPDLVARSLAWAQARLGGDPGLDPALRLVDTELFACFTARGRVHRGLAQALLALERLGRARLTHSADAARSLLLGERRVSEVALLAGG